jgi:hypothetical protein
MKCNIDATRIRTRAVSHILLRPYDGQSILGEKLRIVCGKQQSDDD